MISPLMKNIVVLYSGDDWEEMTLSETTRKSFEKFHQLGEEKGVAFFRSSIDWYNSSQGTFEKAWAFRNETWVRVETAIHPDGVLDKTFGHLNSQLLETKLSMLERFPVVNHPFFGLLLDNKFYQAVLFREHMPKTILAHNRRELQAGLTQLPGERLVLKPLSGSGGDGVYVVEKTALPEAIDFPLIAQEFLSTYHGVPGFSENQSVADLRLVYIGRNISYALSRVAKAGSLLTNFHKGASVVRVPEASIPQDARLLCEKILDQLALFPHSMLSIDLMYDMNKKPHLIEINTKPGFDLLYLMNDQDLIKKYFDDLNRLFS